jgi:hypothetical protein
LRYAVANGAYVDLEWLDDRLRRTTSVVYARTHGDDVVYVGKTVNTLEKRMREHLRYIGSPTFLRIQPYRAWAEGKTIVTYAVAPGTAECCGVQVPMAEGLEIALLKLLQPRFNVRIG